MLLKTFNNTYSKIKKYVYHLKIEYIFFMILEAEIFFPMHHFIRYLVITKKYQVKFVSINIQDINSRYKVKLFLSKGKISVALLLTRMCLRVLKTKELSTFTVRQQDANHVHNLTGLSYYKIIDAITITSEHLG